MAGSTRAALPGLERVGGAVAELDLDRAPVHEVELLLGVVVVAPGLVAGREGDGVDAEGVDSERPADLPEAVALAHLVDVPDRIAVALDHALAHGGRTIANLPRLSVS